MTFEETVAVLRQHHQEIWLSFAKKPGKFPAQLPDLWKGAVIESASGAFLAMQTGHCCEWQLTPLHRTPSDGWDCMEMDDRWCITEEFVREFRSWHVFTSGEH